MRYLEWPEAFVKADAAPRVPTGEPGDLAFSAHYTH